MTGDNLTIYYICLVEDESVCSAVISILLKCGVLMFPTMPISVIRIRNPPCYRLYKHASTSNL